VCFLPNSDLLFRPIKMDKKSDRTLIKGQGAGISVELCTKYVIQNVCFFIQI
jgi:hypothetical protein